MVMIGWLVLVVVTHVGLRSIQSPTNSLLSLSLSRPRTRARPQGSRLFIGEPIHETNAVSQ